MTIEKLYLWARNNGVENYQIVISPTNFSYYLEFSFVEIDEKESEVIF